MPIALQHEQDNLYRVEIRGTLQKAEFDRLQRDVAAEMDRIGPVRLLFVLMQFEGLEPHAAWHDLTFYVRRGDAIQRIAIVGDERWRSASLMFANADLRKAPVAFFPNPYIDAARAWLSA
jgi:hypothetical protein